MLTASRSVEVRAAGWGEIDWEAATWEVPASRMKARRPHRVPLPEQGYGDTGGGGHASAAVRAWYSPPPAAARRRPPRPLLR